MLRIEADGHCNACHSHDTKRQIAWADRERAFRKLVENTKARATGYDCVIPVSGGKDSTWQTIKCLEYGLRPLAVTWKTPARTAIGARNLKNLIALGVDHIDYQVNPKVESRFMVKAFERYGSTAIPMHLALFNIPLIIAVRFDIPLVVWGENSAFEYGSADDALTGFSLNADWLATYGVTHGTTAADWLDVDLCAADLTAYFGPSSKELEDAKVRAVFLGYYFEWDPETTRAEAEAAGFRASAEGARTGYYDYADIDDEFISLHHWMKWYKFGFTRTFDNLSLEIRNRRMAREQAVELIRSRGDETPHADIERFCEFAELDAVQFHETANSFRNRDIWRQRNDGVWWIPEFLIENWHWA